jgi:hypothetical protein
MQNLDLKRNKQKDMTTEQGLLGGEPAGVEGIREGDGGVNKTYVHYIHV